MDLGTYLEERTAYTASILRERAYAAFAILWCAAVFITVVAGVDSLGVLSVAALWLALAAAGYRRAFIETAGTLRVFDGTLLLSGLVLVLLGAVHGVLRHSWLGASVEPATVIGGLTLLAAVWLGALLRRGGVSMVRDLRASIGYGAAVSAAGALALGYATDAQAGPLSALFVLGAASSVELLRGASGRTRRASLVALFLCTAGIVAYAPTGMTLAAGAFLVGYASVAIKERSAAAVIGAVLFVSVLLPAHSLAPQRALEYPLVRDIAHMASRVYERAPSAFTIGTGPGSFSNVWNSHRPVDVNKGPLWNAERVEAPHTVVAFAVEYGVPAAGFLVALLLLSLLTLFFRGREASLEGWAASVLAIFLVAAPPSSAPLVMWALVAFSIGFWVWGDADTRVYATTPASFARGAASLAALLSLLVAALVFQHGLARVYHERATRFIDKEAAEAAVHYYERSIAVAPLPDVLAEYAELNAGAARALIDASGGEISEADAAQLATFMDKAHTYAEEARAAEPATFDRELLYANVLFLRAAFLGDRAPLDVYAAYGAAASLAPQHPMPYVLLANAEAVFGDSDEAKRTLYRALLLKPDLAEATLLLRRLGGTPAASE